MGTARQLWSQVRGEHRSGNGEGHPLLRHEDPSLLFGRLIERGYEDFDKKMTALGDCMEKIPVDDEREMLKFKMKVG